MSSSIQFSTRIAVFYDRQGCILQHICLLCEIRGRRDARQYNQGSPSPPDPYSLPTCAPSRVRSSLISSVHLLLDLATGTISTPSSANDPLSFYVAYPCSSVLHFMTPTMCNLLQNCYTSVFDAFPFCRRKILYKSTFFF